MHLLLVDISTSSRSGFLGLSLRQNSFFSLCFQLVFRMASADSSSAALRQEALQAATGHDSPLTFLQEKTELTDTLKNYDVALNISQRAPEETTIAHRATVFAYGALEKSTQDLKVDIFSLD